MRECIVDLRLDNQQGAALALLFNILTIFHTLGEDDVEEKGEKTRG